RKQRVIDEIGEPRSEHVLPWDAISDVERVALYSLIGKKARSPVRLAPAPEEPPVRPGCNRLHKGAVPGENPRSRQFRITHQHRAVAAHQRGGEALVLRHGAVEFAEDGGSGGDVDDAVDALVRRRATVVGD